MSSDLRSLIFELRYTSPKDDIVEDFLIPALKKSTNYDRATGFFTSTSLLNLSLGISDLARRGGKMRVITSPRLSLEDLNAIKRGYDLREAIEKSMVRELENLDIPEDLLSDRFGLLAYMIKNGMLEIKIAVMKNIDRYPNSIFHPKFGILSDESGNSIAFSGSFNETGGGMMYNWEDVSVFGFSEEDRVAMYRNEFDRLWYDKDDETKSIRCHK